MPKIRTIRSTFTLRQKRDIMYALLERRRQVKIQEGRIINMRDINLAISDLPPHQGRWQKLWNIKAWLRMLVS